MKTLQQIRLRIDSMKLREKLRLFATRIDALQLRERVLLLGAGILTMFILTDTFCLQPAFKQQEQSKLAISGWHGQLAELQTRTGLLSSQSGTGPGYLREMQRDQLRKELAALDDNFRNRLGTLLEPGQAVQILEQVLEQEQGLKLSEAIAVNKPHAGPAPGNATTAPVADISRYELQLQLEGSYLATLRYLQALEALPWKFFWDGVDFEVIEYPVARVTIDIHTLGLPG